MLFFLFSLGYYVIFLSLFCLYLSLLFYQFSSRLSEKSRETVERNTACSRITDSHGNGQERKLQCYIITFILLQFLDLTTIVIVDGCFGARFDRQIELFYQH